MRVSTVFLLGLASAFSPCILAESKFSLFNLKVAKPPPSPSEFFDDSRFTYVHDDSGHIEKLDMDKVKNESVPDFSVEDDIYFELFTRQNPIEPQILCMKNITTLKLSNFNGRLPTRIVIHGWYSEGILTPKFANAYLVKGRYKVNFIAVNWRKGSDIYNYFVARKRVPDVGRHVAKFIDFMVENAGLKMNFLTVIGHSLGAHISGVAGKLVTQGRISKIVGLDPALPFFKKIDPKDRLNETDADYVEVIYTCAGTLGFCQPIGHANFYPNGGCSQPGCGLDIFGICAHGRAYELYLESINNQSFYAFECDSIANLQKGNCSVVDGSVRMGGEPGNRMRKGIYYLETNGSPEYSKGKEWISQTLNQAKVPKSWFHNVFGL